MIIYSLVRLLVVPHSQYLFFCRQNLLDLIEVHLSSLFFIAVRDPQCPLYFGKNFVFPYRSPSTANLKKTNKGYGDYAAVYGLVRNCPCCRDSPSWAGSPLGCFHTQKSLIDRRVTTRPKVARGPVYHLTHRACTRQDIHPASP